MAAGKLFKVDTRSHAQQSPPRQTRILGHGEWLHRDRRQASHSAILSHLADDRDTDAELLPIYLQLLNPEYATRLLAVIDSDRPKRRLFARQIVLRALRYAIEVSSDTVQDDEFELYTALVVTHFWAGTLGHGEGEVAADDDPLVEFGDLPVGLTLDVVRNEVFNRTEDPLVLLSRAKMLWEITTDPVEYPLRVAPEDLLANATGLSSVEWLSFGFGPWAHRNSDPPGGPMWMPKSYFSGADPAKRYAFLDGVAADRERLAAGFEDLDRDWGFVPFEQSPLLTDGTDHLVLDVPFLIDRVTTGLYWYVLDFERTVGDERREAWQRAFGSIFEQYALGIAERLALPLLTGGSTFYGPEDLKRAAVGKSPDCAIDFGNDLVLLEVVGGRLTPGSRVHGDERALANDTYKLVYKKAEQLDSFIGEMLDDETPLVGSLAPDGRRYFPVVVNPGSYPVNPMTMTAVEAHLEGKGWFSDGGVEPLAIIDIGELEIVEALKEHGVGTLPEHLGSWIASDLHRVSLRNHLYDKIDASRGDVFPSAALLEA